MVQYIIKIYNVKIKDIRLMQWVGVCYFLFRLYYVSNSCVAAVAYLACEEVVLDALVFFFILVSVVKRSFRCRRLRHLHIWAWNCYMFSSVRRGYYIEKFFCIYVEVLIQNVGVRSSLIWGSICRMMGVHGAQLIDVCFVCIEEVIIDLFLYYLLHWWF